MGALSFSAIVIGGVPSASIYLCITGSPGLRVASTLRLQQLAAHTDLSVCSHTLDGEGRQS